jgi:hypothetical protein
LSYLSILYQASYVPVCEYFDGLIQADDKQQFLPLTGHRHFRVATICPFACGQQRQITPGGDAENPTRPLY